MEWRKLAMEIMLRSKLFYLIGCYIFTLGSLGDGYKLDSPPSLLHRFWLSHKLGMNSLITPIFYFSRCSHFFSIVRSLMELPLNDAKTSHHARKIDKPSRDKPLGACRRNGIGSFSFPHWQSFRRAQPLTSTEISYLLWGVSHFVRKHRNTSTGS